MHLSHSHKEATLTYMDKLSEAVEAYAQALKLDLSNARLKAEYEQTRQRLLGLIVCVLLSGILVSYAVVMS